MKDLKDVLEWWQVSRAKPPFSCQLIFFSRDVARQLCGGKEGLL